MTPAKTAALAACAAIRAIQRLGRTLDSPQFAEIVAALTPTKNSTVILSGLGKSGHVARKAEATFNSLGIRARYIHPVEALHGDLGATRSEDTAVLISNSGETAELIMLACHLDARGVPSAALTGREESTLAQMCEMRLTLEIPEEGCPIGKAPMASTTAQVVMLDCLAAAIAGQDPDTLRKFAENHPGGSLGRDTQNPV